MKNNCIPKTPYMINSSTKSQFAAYRPWKIIANRKLASFCSMAFITFLGRIKTLDQKA